MTIKELYNKAKENGCEDYEIWICYWDECYPAYEYDKNVINDDDKRFYL